MDARPEPGYVRPDLVGDEDAGDSGECDVAAQCSPLAVAVDGGQAGIGWSCLRSESARIAGIATTCCHRCHRCLPVDLRSYRAAHDIAQQSLHYKCHL